MIAVASGRIRSLLQQIVFSGKNGFVRQSDEAHFFQFSGADSGGSVFVRFAIKDFARNGLLQNNRVVAAGDNNARAGAQTGG